MAESSDTPSNADEASDASTTASTTASADAPPLPPRPQLNDDAAPPLAAPYPQVAYDAMPPSLVHDDTRTGRVIASLLCGLFFYTILAMGYAIYWTLSKLS